VSEELAGIGERAREQGLDIGLLAMGFPPDVGGIETQLGQIAAQFLARGHRVHVLCLDTHSTRAPYSASDELVNGVRVRRIAYRYHDHRALADLAQRQAADDAVMAWLAEEPCDLVHVHHASGFGAAALRAVHDMGRPLLLSLHDYWMLCPRGQMWRNDGVLCEEPQAAVCGACLRATWPQLMPSGGGEPRGAAGEPLSDDAAAAQSRLRHALAMLELPQRLFTPSSAARAVFERAGVPRGRIQVIGNGVEAEALAARVAALRAGLAPRGKQLRIGVLGSVQPSKGVLEFARAALALGDAELFIEVHGELADYHGDPSTARALRELAAREPRLELRGAFAHADLARVLAGLDAVAVPSLWNEVHGSSAREARAAGLPVFVSDRGGLVEWDSREGVEVLPAQDPAAWSAALQRFAKAARAAGPQRERAPGPGLRSARQLALELESHYVELVREQLGREPRLVFEPGSEARRGAAAAAAPKPAAATNWWRRILGH